MAFLPQEVAVVGDVSRETLPPDKAHEAAAAEVFGPGLALAERYAGWLADQGVLRGLIGPREVPRLWDRHLLNCAVVGELIPAGLRVRDIGSGAGLPGIPLALARPDLEVELVEPLLRRAKFLTETCSLLGLPNVTVTKSRAEDLRMADPVPVVTARAVAPVLRLAQWCLPLISPGGSLVALKGARVHEELDGAAADLVRLGAASWEVAHCGSAVLAEPTTVLRVVRSDRAAQAGRRPTGPGRSGGGARGRPARRSQTKGDG